MDIGSVIAALGLDREPLAFEGRFQDKPFLTNWLTVDRCDGTRFRFRSVAVIDGRVLGTGMPPVTSRAELELDDACRPLRYASAAQGRELVIAFADRSARAVMPDGSTHKLDGERPFALLENNHPAQIALMLAILQPQRAEEPQPAVPVFLASALTQVPYGLTAEPGGFRSSLGEWIELGADGTLQELSAQDGAVVISRLPEAPPMPRVEDDSAPARGYNPPEGLQGLLQEISIDGPQGAIGATLVVPAAPVGAVLVIQGSGAVDRHGFADGVDTGTHVFADDLAERGFIVLRYDKRGVGKTRRADDTLDSGYAEAVSDAAHCLRYLRDRAGGLPCFVLGHSLGGLTALVLSAEQYGGALPLVLLAPPGRPLRDVIRDQIHRQGERLGLTGETIGRQLADFDAFLSYASGDAPPEGVPANVLAGRLMRRMFAELGRVDPAELIAGQTAPVLVCQGLRDIQIDAGRDTGRLEQAARDAHVEIAVHRFETLNHLFREAQEGEGVEGYASARPVAPDAVRVVTDWCLVQATRQAGGGRAGTA